MIIVLFLMQAVADPKLDACTAAVRADLASAASACTVAQGNVDLWGTGGATSTCLPAMAAGRQAGELGPKLSMPMRAGLVSEFEKELARCKAAPRAATPVRPTTNLWD